MSKIKVTAAQRNRIQVSYFHEIWKQFNEIPLYERFAMAVVLSSDDVFEKAFKERPDEVMKYIELRRKNRRKRKQCKKEIPNANNP